jgi:monoamine oxidase
MHEHKSLTRRTFLERVGKTGGSTAVYSAMSALGLLAIPRPAAFALNGRGTSKRIVILGAGLAGMCAAYELAKLGYDCHILEARMRSGGRCHTIRRGTVETDTDGHEQTCRFDEGLYLNPGPARIPQHHVTLDYCRELNVPIEMFNNDNQQAYLYKENAGPLSGKRVRMREARADMYGYTSELLAKAVSQSELDQRLTADDKSKLVEYLRAEGNLSPDLFYKGAHTQPYLPMDEFPNDRRGYRVNPGAGDQPGTPDDPFDMSALIQSGFGLYFQFPNELDQQMTMFQIVGGTHNLAKGFERKVGSKITFGAVVQEIRQSPNGVRVVYRETHGNAQEITGDYCICAIPLSVLKGISSDFSPAMQRAIAGVPYMAVGKIGLQFKRRFWEEDDKIFGGMSRTNMPITQIWYPATGFLGRKGVLVGYYNYGPNATAMSGQPHAQREAQALEQGAKIHPQYPKEFENSFSAAWHKTPYTMGGWAGYRGTARRDLYPVLNQPDGRIYLAGEHLSYLTGWMAGALESARKVCHDLHDRASAEARLPAKRNA